MKTKRDQLFEGGRGVLLIQIQVLVRLLKSVAAMSNRHGAYQLDMVRHCIKTAFIVGGLLTINPGFTA